MPFPNDTNGDVLRRMEAHGFDFANPHDVEFFAIFPSEDAADIVAKQYVADHKAGDRLENIETKPVGGGSMQLILVKRMLVTYENVTQFENNLAERVKPNEGRLDGWGVMQG